MSRATPGAVGLTLLAAASACRGSPFVASGQLTASGLDLGAVGVRTVISQPLSVANLGGLAVSVTAATLDLFDAGVDPAIDAGDAGVDAGGAGMDADAGDPLPEADAGAGGLSLGEGLVGRFAPHAGRSALLTFAPTAPGPIRAALALLLEDGRRLTFPLSGSAVAPPATIDATPDQLDYQQIPLHTQSTQQFQLSNPTLEAVPVTSSGPAPDGGFSLLILPATLQPLSSETVVVKFTPDSAGTFVDAIDFRTCPACPPLRVTLSGEGVPALLQAEEVDFGAVRRGGQATQWLSLADLGRAPLQIDRLEIAADGGLSSPFSSAPPNDAGTGFLVAADGGVRLPVTFAPFSDSAPGPVEGTLLVTYEAVGVTGPAVVEVRLTGEVQLDCFLAPTPGVIDFGLVVPGRSKPRSEEVLVTNIGKDPCTVLDAGLTAESDPAFELPSGQVGLPGAAVAPGVRVSLGKVQFAPALAAPPFPRRGGLWLTTAEGSLTVPLQGWAQSAPFAAASSCPRWRCDQGNSGLNRANLANNRGSVQWTRWQDLGGFGNNQPVIGGDGTVLVSQRTGLAAVAAEDGLGRWLAPLPGLDEGPSTPVALWDGRLALQYAAPVNSGLFLQLIDADGGLGQQLALGSVSGYDTALEVTASGDFISTPGLVREDSWDLAAGWTSSAAPASLAIGAGDEIVSSGQNLLAETLPDGGRGWVAELPFFPDGAEVALACGGGQVLAAYSRPDAFNNRLQALDLASGAATWHFDTPWRTPFRTPALRADGTIVYAATEDQATGPGGSLPVHVFALSAEGLPLWEAQPPVGLLPTAAGGPDTPTAPMVSLDNYTLIAGNALALLDPDGGVVWTVPVGGLGGLAADPIVGPDGAIYLLDALGNLSCLR